MTSHVHAHNDFLLSQVEHEDSSFTIVDFESSPQPKHVSDIEKKILFLLHSDSMQCYCRKPTLKPQEVGMCPEYAEGNDWRPV